MPINKTIANYYIDDARHFLQRYRLLPIEEFNKAGRVKNFMDIVMAAECALKAHIFTDAPNDRLVATYREMRRMSHDISSLADRAHFLGDRSGYDAIKARLGDLSIGLRYSLDMWESYFPSLGDDNRSRLYDRTMANTEWRNAAISEIEFLLNPFQEPVVVEGDLAALLKESAEMEAFVRTVRIRD